MRVYKDGIVSPTKNLVFFNVQDPLVISAVKADSTALIQRHAKCPHQRVVSGSPMRGPDGAKCVIGFGRRECRILKPYIESNRSIFWVYKALSRCSVQRPISFSSLISAEDNSLRIKDTSNIYQTIIISSSRFGTGLKVNGE